MKLIKHTLFQTLSEQTILKYSLCKFGDPQIISEFGKKLSTLIKTKLTKNKEYILYTTDIANEDCYKNSFLLTSEIAKLVGLELIIGEYSFTYDKHNFYDNKKAVDRKNHIPKLRLTKKSINGKTVVIIDDSFFTGKTLSVIIQDLKKHTDDFLFFSIINLSGQTKFAEEAVNSYFFEKKGIEGLVELINKEGYIITTHILRTIEKLSVEHKNFLISHINLNQKEGLQKSYRQYIGEDLL